MYRSIKGKQLFMSRGVFHQISRNLLSQLPQYFAQFTAMLTTEPSLLTILTETPGNSQHIINIQEFSNEIDLLMINLLLGSDKNNLETNATHDQLLVEVFKKSNLIMQMIQMIQGSAPESKNEHHEYLLEELVKGFRVLNYELSCLQKMMPMFFKCILKEYLLFAYNLILKDWQDEDIFKSLCFMLLKVLKTYVYYEGRG